MQPDADDLGADFGPVDIPVTPGPNQPQLAVVDAPYGINPKTGKPFKYDAETRQRLSDQMARGRTAKATSSGSKRTTAAKAAKATRSPLPPMRQGPKPAPAAAAPKREKTRWELLVEVFEPAGMAIALAGWKMRMPAVCADGITLGAHAEDLAEGIDELGNEHPDTVGKVLDFVAKASPYAKLATVLTGLGTQFLANHKVIPGGLFGSRPRDEIINTWATAMLAAGVDLPMPSVPADVVQEQAPPTPPVVDPYNQAA